MTLRFASTKLFALCIAALLYGAASSGATPAMAGELPDTVKAELEAMRSGDLGKLIVNKQSRDRYDKPFTNVAGDEMTYAAFEGKVVLVNFWATWCAPCREEMPSIDRLQATLGGDDFQVAAISVDRRGMGAVTDFFDEISVEHLTPYLDKRGKLAVTHGVIGLPGTVILDRDGREIARMTGPAEWDSPEAIAILTRIIEATRPESG